MTTTNNTTDAGTIRVYLANLAAYNAGYLVGRWVSLPCDDLAAELSAIGCGPDGDEHAIHDYESDLDGHFILAPAGYYVEVIR